MGSITAGEDAPLDPDFNTQVVVVGTGPAGGSLAAFLGSHGRDSGTQPFEGPKSQEDQSSND